MSNRGGRYSHGQRSLQHGKRPKGYAAWVNMRQRCTNPKSPDFKNYGGRGISYCERWELFENFLADMGEPATMNLTLDRIDTNGMYEKNNCRWVTRAVQNLNRRNCVRYDYQGKSLTLAEWARHTGIGRVTLIKRLRAGWSIEKALTEKPTWTPRVAPRNHRYEYAGQSLTLAEWAKAYEMSYVMLLKRLRRGWSIQRALTGVAEWSTEIDEALVTLITDLNAAGFVTQSSCQGKRSTEDFEQGRHCDHAFISFIEEMSATMRQAATVRQLEISDDDTSISPAYEDSKPATYIAHNRLFEQKVRALLLGDSRIVEPDDTAYTTPVSGTLGGTWNDEG